MTLTSNYTIKAVMKDKSTKDLEDAAYNTITDRLVIQAPADKIWLPQLEQLQLTKK